MAKKSRKKTVDSKRRSPKKCSTPILGKSPASGSLGLSSIGTSSSSTQVNARQRSLLEWTRQTKSRIAKKRPKKNNVRKRKIRIKSNTDTDAEWETESEASVHEDADSKYLPCSPRHTVVSPKLFCDNPERVRDAQHFGGTTLDEPILPNRHRNTVVPFEKDPIEEGDDLLDIDFPHSFEIQSAKDYEAETDVQAHGEEECPTFNPARVLKTYPSAVRRNKTMSIVKLNGECLIDMPPQTAYADVLWREFIMNNDVMGVRGNGNDLSAVRESDATSSGDEIMQFDEVAEQDDMNRDAERWDMKRKKWIRINAYNILPQKHKSKVKDREPIITEIRRKYVKRTSEGVENPSICSKAGEAFNTSTRYRVFEFPTNKEQFFESFVKEKIVIPPPSKKPRIISVAIRRTTAYKKEFFEKHDKH